MTDAYEFTSKNGIALSSDYHRYQGHVGRCKSKNKTSKWFNAGGKEEDFIDNMRLKALVSHQPVGVAMYANNSCLVNYS